MRLVSMLGKLPIFRSRLYPIIVEIRKPRQNGFETLFDRARRVKFVNAGKSGLDAWELNLLFEKVDVQLPSNYQFEIDHHGKQKIYLLNPEYGVFMPITPTLNSKDKELEFVLQGQGRMGWLLGTLKKNSLDIQTTNKWEKYMPMISMLTFGVILVISMIFYAQGVEKQMGLMSQIMEAAERIFDSLSKIAPPP